MISFLHRNKKKYPTMRQRVDIFRVALRRKILMALPFVKKTVILSRTACLGRELIDLKYGTKNVFIWNQQKTRVDVFMDWIFGQPRPKWKVVRPFIKREDLLLFMKQQEHLPWLHLQKKPDLIVMDSLSELLDQKFTHKKEDWSFCAYHSDVDKDASFVQTFDNNGLLKLEEFEKAYETFFEWLTKTYPNTDIIFIHYPTAWVSAKEREFEILRVLKSLEKTYPIYNICLPESKVEWDNDNKFLYHFTENTKKSFVKEWQKVEKMEQRVVL